MLVNFYYAWRFPKSQHNALKVGREVVRLEVRKGGMESTEEATEASLLNEIQRNRRKEVGFVNM
jgi:hypothetical protein